MIVQVGGTLGQKNGRLRMIDHADQHRRRTNGFFPRDFPQPLVDVGIAACGNDRGIGKRGGHGEAQSGTAALEEFFRTDGSRIGIQYRLTQRAFLT